jgi:hypothetical protein
MGYNYMTKNKFCDYRGKHSPGDYRVFPGPKQILDDNKFADDCEMERIATRLLKTGHVVISTFIRRLPLLYCKCLSSGGNNEENK